jgi:hypothetical protein
MVNEIPLREVIVTIIEHVKQNRVYCVKIGNEVAAFRNALQELTGEKFLPLLGKHQIRIQEIAAALGGADAQYFDALIQQVKSGELF